MPTEFPPLIDILKQIPDPRHAQGKRHPLHAILAMLCVASLCGYQTYSAMAERGRHYGAEFLCLLGFTRVNRLAKRRSRVHAAPSAASCAAWKPA